LYEAYDDMTYPDDFALITKLLHDKISLQINGSVEVGQEFSIPSAREPPAATPLPV